MKTARVIILFVLAIALACTAAFAAKEMAAERSFKAALTGRDEVPSVKTKAKGEATFVPGKDGSSLMYTIKVTNIRNVLSSHIHEGKKGKNGPPVVILFSGPKKEGKFSGTLSEGKITANELVGPLKGKPLKSLVEMIESGDLYVNVHTDQYPEGEVRGQIK